MKKITLNIFFLTFFVLSYTFPLMAETNFIHFYSEGNENLFFDREKICFEKAESGNVMVDAWVVRKNLREEKSEHWKFSFRLPVLRKIVSGQSNSEGCLFPCRDSDVKMFQALLKNCVDLKIFPQEIVKLSDFLQDS